MFTKNYRAKYKSGQLLLEIILAVAASAIIVTLGAQMAYVSLYSNKSAEEKNVAVGLIEETFEGINGVATEKWQDLFNLTKNSVQYHTATSTNKWVILANAETVTINQKEYVRSFTVQNVCRGTDPATRDVTGITDTNGSATTCTTNGGEFDPSTQKVNVTVSWPGADPITFSDYITRWRNKACKQTDWGGGQTSPADPNSSCLPAINTYYSTDGNINTSGGELKLQ